MKVVLKWHGAGRASRVKRNQHQPAKKEDNGKRKKRVIVYKNGDPTAGASASFPSERPAESHQKLEMEVKDVCTKEMNIITNPLDSTTESRSAEAVFRSRRYSMQERLSQPPPLVRRVSEIHTTGGQQPSNNNNSRRNRHSWTVGTLPEIPLNFGEIGIDIDQEDC